MKIMNDSAAYGAVSKLLHWVMALLIMGLITLGMVMVTLDYTHPWSIKALSIHLGLGVLVGFLLIVRYLWRLVNPVPLAIVKPWQQITALWVHRFFYLLIATIVTSGYLISTADGKGLSVFGWFDLPASFYGYPNQEGIAGSFHELLSYVLIALIVLHSVAATKHHFFEK